ncbi:MAG: c-type cytochrome [Myxococcales bacterium]|nr:c-type cytochrome [Myxococcales bacterium]
MKWLMIPILVGGMGGAAFAEFKNLQVLPKTISKDELKAYMKAQSKALGVECDYCHDVPDMASDKNDKKQIARKMIQMTNDVNDKWLRGMKDIDKNKVTCSTCHQGHELPPKLAPAGEKAPPEKK